MKLTQGELFSIFHFESEECVRELERAQTDTPNAKTLFNFVGKY